MLFFSDILIHGWTAVHTHDEFYANFTQSAGKDWKRLAQITAIRCFVSCCRSHIEGFFFSLILYINADGIIMSTIAPLGIALLPNEKSMSEVYCLYQSIYQVYPSSFVSIGMGQLWASTSRNLS